MNADGVPSVPDKHAPRFKCSINPLWPGQKLKPKSDGETRWGRHTGAWRTEAHTLESFAQRVCVDGFAFCSVLTAPWRKGSNFESLQVLATDHDEAALEALLEDTFIQDHAALVYETVSSTLEKPRSRAVYILDQPIKKAGYARLAYRALIAHFANGEPDTKADEACKDPTRFFYGRPHTRHVLLRNILYTDTLQDVIEAYSRATPRLFTGSEADQQPRQFTGAYNPHTGPALSEDDRQRLAQELAAARLKLCGDRFNGPCILPHRNGPCDCPGAMYVSAITGFWHCFCGDHVGRNHGGVRVLHILATDEQQAGDDPGGDPHPDDEGDYEQHTDRERRRALVEARMTALYGARRAYAARLIKAGDVDLDPPGGGRLNRHGRLGLKTFDDIPILLETPGQAPGKVDLLELRRQVEPRTDRDWEMEQQPHGVRLLETCGWGIDATCLDHGIRFQTRRSCRLLDHSQCPTGATERLRVLTLPAPPVGGSYRTVWLVVLFDLPTEDGAQAVSDVADNAVRAVHRVARRKLGAGLLSRSSSFVMGHTESAAHVKLLFLDQTPGESDAAIAAVCAELGAAVIGDKRLPTADLAVLQLVEDTMYHLAALEEPDPELYAAWFFGVKGRRLFQSYGLLHGKLDEGWVKGTTTIVAGMAEAPMEHGLGTQVKVEAQPSGFLPKGWRIKGHADGRAWEVTAAGVELDRPASRDLTFAWRARQDTHPVCDVCGARLDMVLVPPTGAEAEEVGGARWG